MTPTELLEAPAKAGEATMKNKTKDGGSRPARATAETMAGKQRDISVSEFFAKNRHLLGFDNPRKALLTTVKEAVDNSLDACEEAGILPEIAVVIEDLLENGGAGKNDKGGAKGQSGSESRSTQAKATRYRVSVVDNGPGIVRKQVENVFGRLLFGSKFHRLKMSRGQQGIGISAAGMFGLITTGRPMVIHTRPKERQPAHHIELAMNTKTNRAEVTVDDETDDFPPARLRSISAGTRDLTAKNDFLAMSAFPTGTSVSIELEGRYQKGRGSVDEFLELTAIANPHARIVFVPPGRISADEEEDTPLLKTGKKGEKGRGKDEGTEDGEPGAQGDPALTIPAPAQPLVTTEIEGLILYPRAVSELPPETKEIQPHPRGIELGILLQMLKEAQGERETYTLYNFLQDKFCRVSSGTASALCEKIKVTARTKISDVDHAMAEKLFRELQEAKLPPPPTDCLAPIGVRQLLAGLLKGVRAEFYAASSREAAVYRGRPFQIEAAIAFGGQLAADEAARVIRFANRVPLLYQQSACSSFKSVVETNWRNYDLQHPRSALPVGPLVIMIHMASVWVPFTSESKEAIADYDEIRKEMKLALMECGRKLGTYLRKRQKMRREGERRDVFQKYIGEIAQACNAINGVDTKKLFDALLEQAKKKTAIADLHLDEDGKAVKDEDPADQEGVIIVAPEVVGAVAGVGGAAPAVVELDDPPVRKRSASKGARSHGAKKAKDDDQPTLIDTEPVKRLSQKGKSSAAKGAKSAKVEKAGQARAPKEVQLAAPAAPAASKSVGEQAGSLHHNRKPKMRLDPKSGKLVPVDDGPRLF